MNLHDVFTELDQLLAEMHKDNKRWQFRIVGDRLEEKYIGPNANIPEWREWHDSGQSVEWWLTQMRNEWR